MKKLLFGLGIFAIICLLFGASLRIHDQDNQIAELKKAVDPYYSWDERHRIGSLFLSGYYAGFLDGTQGIHDDSWAVTTKEFILRGDYKEARKMLLDRAGQAIRDSGVSLQLEDNTL